jgi:hypothetical protein
VLAKGKLVWKHKIYKSCQKTGWVRGYINVAGWLSNVGHFATMNSYFMHQERYYMQKISDDGPKYKWCKYKIIP